MISSLITRPTCVLVTLKLVECRIEEQGHESIFGSLINSRTVKEINIKGNPFRRDPDDPMTISNLSDMSQLNNSIKEFDFSDCMVGDAGCHRMFSGLQAGRIWDKIDLSDNHITKDGIQYIAWAFK